MTERRSLLLFVIALLCLDGLVYWLSGGVWAAVSALNLTIAVGFMIASAIDLGRMR